MIEERPRHPNPIADLLPRWIVEREINQAIGRGRGVNRTADNPLDVYLLNDVVMPHFVELLPPDILDMPPDVLMLAQGDVAVGLGGSIRGHLVEQLYCGASPVSGALAG